MREQWLESVKAQAVKCNVTSLSLERLKLWSSRKVPFTHEIPLRKQLQINITINEYYYSIVYRTMFKEGLDRNGC